MMVIYLVRHGKDDPSIRGGWSGHGLIPEGAAQAEDLAAELARDSLGLDRLYSSDLRRAAETAEMLARGLGLPVEYLPGFREANNGELAGMENELANVRYPGLYWSSLEYEEPYPGGESPKEFFERVREAWDGLKRRQTGGNALLVTHGGVIEAIMCIENGVEFTNRERRFSAPNCTLLPVNI